MTSKQASIRPHLVLGALALILVASMAAIADNTTGNGSANITVQSDMALQWSSAAVDCCSRRAGRPAGSDTRLHEAKRCLVDGLEAIEQEDGARDLSFEEKLALIVDRQYTWRQNLAFQQRLKRARLRGNACVEDIDYRWGGRHCWWGRLGDGAAE